MLKSSKKTDLADVIVYVYDSSDTNSFSYISNLRVHFSSCMRIWAISDVGLTATIQPRSHTNTIRRNKIGS